MPLPNPRRRSSAKSASTRSSRPAVVRFLCGCANQARLRRPDAGRVRRRLHHSGGSQSSGGGVDIKDADSTVSNNPRVFNLVGADAKITAATISLLASGATADEVLTAMGGFGILFSSGGVDAVLNRSATVTNSIGDRAVLDATGANHAQRAGVVRRLRQCLGEFRRLRRGVGGCDAAIESHRHE